MSENEENTFIQMRTLAHTHMINFNFNNISIFLHLVSTFYLKVMFEFSFRYFTGRWQVLHKVVETNLNWLVFPDGDMGGPDSLNPIR